MATTRHRRPAPDAARATPAPRVRDDGVDEPDGTSENAPGAPSLIAPGSQAILHHALEEAARLLRSDGAMAYILDPETGILRFADDAGITDDRNRNWVQTLEMDPGVGLFGRAVAEGRIQMTGDYPADPGFVHFSGADRLVESLDIHSFLVAPIIAGDRTFGALGTYSSRVDTFGEHDVALVRALADHVAVGMANAELIQALAASRAEVERRADAERALREIGARITAVTDPSEVLQLAVDEAARLLATDGARIDLLNERDGALYWAHDATTGKRPGLGPIAGTGEARAGEGISGRAVLERRPVFTGDYLNDERFEHAEQPDAHVRKHQIRSVVAVPLIGDRGPLGTLTVYSSEVDAFSEADARLLEALAGQAAIAMTNASLIARLAASQADERRRADEERALREIAARITAIRDPSDLLQDVVDEAARLLSAEKVRIDLIGHGAGRIGYTFMGAGPHIGGAAVDDAGDPFAYGAAGRAIAERRSVVVADYASDETFAHDPELDAAVAQDGIRSLVVTPLIAEETLLGVLQVGSLAVDAFGPDQVGLAEALAHQAAIAIRNSRLIEALERSAEQIRQRAAAEQALREIATRITAIRDPNELLQQVTDSARRLLDGERAQLDIVDPQTGLIRWTTASGEGRFAGGLPGTREGVAAEVGINSAAIAEGRVVSTDDYLVDPRINHVPESDAFVEQAGIRSVVAAPLTSDAGLVGILKVATTREAAFGEEARNLMAAFADQVVVAIQNAHLIDELGRSREEISRRADAERSVREIAANISALRDVDAILQQTVDEARRLLASNSARIDMLDDDGITMRWAYASGEDAIRTRDTGFDREFRIGEGIAGLTVRTGVAFRTGDYAADDRFTHTPRSDALVEATGFRSVLSAPLRGESGPLGAISVSSELTDHYDDNEAELLQALADQAAIAIQNARLISRLERSQAELEARAETERSLRDISARITSLGDPAEILARVVEESRRLLGSDGAHLTRMSDDGTYLVPVIVAGGMDVDTEAWLKSMTFPLGGGINGLAAEEVRPIWTADYPADPRIPHEPGDDEAASRLGLRAMAAAPLRAPAGEVIGTLAVSYAVPREIKPDELDLLQGLADQAAIALTNSNLYELLGESEGRYRHLVQNSPDLVWSIGPDARFTFVSDTCQRLTGWRPEELLGQHFGALVHESSREVAEIDWTAGIEDDPDGVGRELRGRVNLLHREGRPVPAEFIAFATRDENGAFAGANGSVRDMSERDRLERELRESEERFRFLIENSPDIIFAVDADGRFSYVSETVRRSLGREPEDIVGRPFTDLIIYGPGDEPGSRFELLRNDPTRELTNRLMLRHADGRAVPFEVSSVGIHRDGEFAGIQGAARDVAERERLERELRESEERYRFLVENSPDIIFSTDHEGTFTYVSDSIERITGFSPAEYVGNHFSHVIDPPSVPAAAERWAALLADPANRQIVKLDLRRKGGGTVPVEVSSIGTTVDGRFAGIHGATRDITDRERLERDLRRQAGELASSQERAHLARELHDSVTQALFSMTLVTRSVELLIDRDPESAKSKLTSLRDLQREALAEMRALIFELRPGNLESDGLLPALRTHTAALQGRIGLPVVVTSELSERLPLEVEEVLYRIAQEALHNVVKHAAARQVEIALDRRDGDVVLRIRDDGKGFDERSVADGHLGITGMRARADKIGARYTVMSRPGQGTTIEVSVPASAAVPRDPPPGDATREPIRSGG